MNRFLTTAAALCGIASHMAGQTPPAAVSPQQPSISNDVIDLPPTQRQVVSASGAYTLALRTPDGWKTPHATASLTDRAGKVLWRAELPHHHGPRVALVTDAGYVLLVDEWIHILSLHALTLNSPAGRTIIRYSAEQLVALLGVSPRAVTEHARNGTWLTAGPELSPDRKFARFEAGGRSFRIHLADGGFSLQ